MSTDPFPPITENEITEGLRNDPEYGRPEVMGYVLEFVSHLPAVLEEWLPQTVTLQRFFAAKLHFLTRASEEWGYAYAPEELQDILDVLAVWADDPSLAFTSEGLSEKEYMLSDHMSLFPILKPLYSLNQLIFADLVRYQPSIFLP
jgi:hypothetical protein